VEGEEGAAGNLVDGVVVAGGVFVQDRPVPRRRSYQGTLTARSVTVSAMWATAGSWAI
jgi:hypothetical protein